MWTMNTLGGASEPLGYWISKLSFPNSTNALGIATDSNGNIYACGNVRTSDTFGFGDAFIAKYNNLGEVQWHKFLGGTGSDSFNAIAIDSNDNIYVAGQSNSLGQSATSGILVKYNSSGIQQWQRAFGLQTTLKNYFWYAIGIDSFDKIYVAGDGKNSLDNQTGTIAKYDSSGEILWQFTLDGGPSSFQAMHVTESGDFYTVGTVSAGIEGGQDTSIIKYNLDGYPQWQKNIGTSANDNINWGIAKDSSGNIYLSGRVSVSGSTDAILLKLSSSGSLIWQRTIAGSASTEAYYGVAIDSLGNVYMAGFTTQGSPLDNGFVVKYTSSGLRKWQRSFGGVGYEYLRNIHIDANDNLYLVGYSVFNYEFILTKLGTDGNLIGTFKVGDLVITYQSVDVSTPIMEALTISDTSYLQEISPALVDTATLSEESRTLSGEILYF